MADYKFNDTVKIPFERIKNWSAEIYQKCGMNEKDAATTAEIQANSDLRGVYSHGVQRCATYVNRLKVGSTSPSAQPSIERDAKALVLVDGHNAMGQVVANYAAELAVERAKLYGTATISIKGSNHVGAMAYYAMQIAKKDMIGICMTQGAGNSMAPWGGTEKILGNNPFSYAVPAYSKPMVVLDMAQSVVAAGKIDIARTTGVSIPDTWALDKNGVPITDPNEFFTLQPVGGYKGYGLSFIMTLLCAVYPNCPYGRDQIDLFSTGNEPQNGGQMVQAIDIQALMDVDDFKKRVDVAIETYKNSNRRSGVAEILVPGEPEARTEARQMKEGIEYPVELMKKLDVLSREMGVQPLI